MIARIHFIGTVRQANKKSTLTDYVDIHVGDLGQARPIFESWIGGNSLGIRGASGVFHPLGVYGEIKVKKVEEHDSTA